MTKTITSPAPVKYAVIKDGGKQYEVKEGDKVLLERKSAADGAEIEFKEVLLYADGPELKIGQPLLNGITVKAQVEKQTRGNKVTGVKFRKREGYRRKFGHRQHYTVVKITGIAAS